MAIFKIKYYHLKQGTWIVEALSLSANNTYKAKIEASIVLKGNIIKNIEQIDPSELGQDLIYKIKDFENII